MQSFELDKSDIQRVKQALEADDAALQARTMGVAYSVDFGTGTAATSFWMIESLETFSDCAWKFTMRR